MGLRTEARLPSPKSQSQVEAPLEVSLNCTCCPRVGVSGENANEAARPPGRGVAVGVGTGPVARKPVSKLLYVLQP